jgi:methyltransferase (TIGR00027 family)
MDYKSDMAPDSTAVRVALWRALHTRIDAFPHIVEDEIGLQLVAPDEAWRDRPDMQANATSGFRAGVVARARFVEDLVREQFNRGVRQYVILGAGLDTFAQRTSKDMSGLNIFEVDKPGAQDWKRQRLMDLGLGVPKSLHLVAVNFEAGDLWWEKLTTSGFNPNQAAVVASTGVSLYLSEEAIKATLDQVALLAAGTTLAMTFYLPMDLVDSAERPMLEMVLERARAAGTPFLSFFSPSKMQALALKAGFRTAEHVSRAELIQRYFMGRSDGLQPASGEEFLVATT